MGGTVAEKGYVIKEERRKLGEEEENDILY